jgi:hypothetical protein
MKNESDEYAIFFSRIGLAQNWRRRGMFDEVAFIFPNAPSIPITVVRWASFATPFVLFNKSILMKLRWLTGRRHDYAWMVWLYSAPSQRMSNPLFLPFAITHDTVLLKK